MGTRLSETLLEDRKRSMPPEPPGSAPTRPTLAQMRAFIDEHHAERMRRIAERQRSAPFELSFHGPVVQTAPPDKHLEFIATNENIVWPNPGAVEEIAAILAGGGMTALLGSRGTGKTQIAAWLWLCCPRRQAMYATAAHLLDTMKSWYGIEGPARAWNKRMLMTVPVLIIDEIHERRGTLEDEHLMISLLDSRYANKAGTLLVGNIKPSEIAANLGQSVASRLREYGSAFDTCQWPRYREELGRQADAQRTNALNALNALAENTP